MQLNKEAWINLLEAADIQNNALRNKCANLHHNSEESAKNGGTETVLGMITEFETTLRVLKRRLIQTLPADQQAKYSPV